MDGGCGAHRARPRERDQVEARDLRPRAPDAGSDRGVDDRVRRSNDQGHDELTSNADAGATTATSVMTLSLNAAAPNFGTLDTPLLVVALSSPPSLGDALGPVDAAIGGAIARVIARRDFRASRDETLHLAGGDRGIQRVLLVGMGGAADRAAALRRAGAIAARQANRLGVGKLAFFAGALSDVEAEAAGLGLAAGAWDFKELKTAPPADEQRAPLTEATILAADGAAAERGVRAARAIAEGHALARRLGMLPGNVCTPDYLADTARDLAKRLGLVVT